MTVGVAMRLDVCKHYRGAVVNDTCRAGINYLDIVGGNETGWFYKIPCMKEHAVEVACGAREFPTEEEVAEFNKWTDERTTLTTEAHRRCRESAIAGGWKKGRQHSGVVQCPACDQQLKYSMAYNGHVWAQCETPGCLRWIN